MNPMPKLLLLAGMLSGMPAEAVLITVNVDDFNAGNQSLSDTTANNVAVTGTVTGLDTAHVIGGGRTLSNNLLASVSPVSSVARVLGGWLGMVNGVGEKPEVRVSWTLPAGLLPTTGTVSDFQFHLYVVGSDNNPIAVSLLMNSVALGSFSIAGNTTNTDLLYSSAYTQINAGGTLQLVLNGDPGWDANFDSFGFQYQYTPPSTSVPAPATLALFGLGALGLYRRRRAV